MHKQPIVRLWGLTTQRGWGRIIFGRLGVRIYGEAALAHRNAAGHVDGAAEQSSYFRTYLRGMRGVKRREACANSGK